MNTLKKMTFRRRQLATLAAGLLVGVAAAAPLMAVAGAVSSPETLDVMGRAPTLISGTVKANDVDHNSTLDVGDTLDATFTFDDQDKDVIGSITYTWYAGVNPIPGETGSTLTLTQAMLGQTITVSAKAHTDTATTNPSESAEVYATDYIGVDGQSHKNGLDVATTGTLKSVDISGVTGSANNPIVADVLTANAQCQTQACDQATKQSLTYQWQTVDAAGAATDIAGETHETYTVTADKQKMKIRVVVTQP